MDSLLGVGGCGVGSGGHGRYRRRCVAVALRADLRITLRAIAVALAAAAGFFLAAARRAFRVVGVATRASDVAARRTIDDVDPRAFAQAVDAIDDHVLAGRDAIVDRDVVAVGRTEFYRSHGDGAVIAYNVHVR